MTNGADRRLDEAPSLGAVLDFMRLLWGLDHALQSVSKRMEADLGVTGPQRLVLRIVGRFPGISAGHLAAILRVHPSTLTGVLARLVTRGFLRRDADPDDARRALLRLTAEGRRRDQVRSATAEASVRRALGRLPPSKVAGARDVLLAIAAELERA